MYYLQSRYLDPKVGRFINGDAYASTGQGILGNNMFSYCTNDPIFYSDSTGFRMVCANILLAGGGSGSISAQKRTQIRDVTDEINAALYPEAFITAVHRLEVNQLKGVPRILGEAYLYVDFYQKVNHEAEWDIKREEPWKKTIGTTYPGVDTQVLYNGIVMTPESLGNYTYGFIGRASGFSLPVLIAGSYYAAGFPTEQKALTNEVTDWLYITIGYLEVS